MLACPAKTMGELRGREPEQGRWQLRGAARIEPILVVLVRGCRALGDWPPIAAEADPSPPFHGLFTGQFTGQFTGAATGVSPRSGAR